MKKTLIFLVMAIVPVMMWACSSDDDKPLTKTELLCKAPWKYQYSECPTGVFTTYTFNTNGTFAFSTCGNPASIAETWEFAENETQLILHYGNTDGGKDDITLTIVKLTETELVFGSGGQTITLTH